MEPIEDQRGIRRQWLSTLRRGELLSGRVKENLEEDVAVFEANHRECSLSPSFLIPANFVASPFLYGSRLERGVSQDKKKGDAKVPESSFLSVRLFVLRAIAIPPAWSSPRSPFPIQPTRRSVPATKS